MKAFRLALALAIPFLLTACSGSSGSSGGAGDSEAGASNGPEVDAGASAADAAVGSGFTSATDAKLVLEIPASFSGATRELDVVVTPSVPIAGPPAGILYQVEKPAIVAGQPLTIHGNTTGVNGAFYVVVVLYMQGGGQFSPAAGIDYEAQTSAPMMFNGTAIDLGTLSLALASSDGGP